VSTGSAYSATASPQLTFNGTTLDVSANLHVGADLDVSGNISTTGNFFLNSYILIPAGTIIQSAAINVPGGWLNCDGTSLTKTTYYNLFLAIGNTYGGSGADLSFNLPDMRGRTAIGVGQGGGLTNRLLGAIGGEENHTLSAGEMPSHTHSLIRRSNPDPEACDAVGPNGNAAESSACTTDRANIGNFSTTSAGSGTAHNNMQPYLVLKYLIKY
jgi:microcystin-dependent protein